MAPKRKGGASKKKASAKQRSKKAKSRGSTRASRAKKPAAKRSPARKSTAKRSRAKKPAARRSRAKKPAARRSAGKKRAAKKKAAAKRPANRAMSKKFLDEQRNALVAERSTYLRQADALREEAEELAANMEPGDVQFDEESGEGATVAVERERDLALSAQARAEIEDIDNALARIDAGVYGVCQQCGKPIPKERLRALPQAALCVACKSGGFGRR